MRAASGMRDRGALGAGLLLALLVSCGRSAKPPLAPPDQLPPQIEAVFPAARSTRVFYDTEIWVRFSEPLDPATVNERTVFLKLDTVRIPVTITWDGAARTIRLAPLTQLALLRTYTVEITRGVETANGQPLAQTYFWQFTTNSLRRLVHPIPAVGTTDESPFAMLQWTRTEPSAGTIAYEVYVGSDSAAVAARSAGPNRTESEPFFVPLPPWGLGARVYWAITAINRTTGERLEGPVWRFETLPPGIPVASLVVPAVEWGYYRLPPQNQAFCMTSTIASGPSYNDGIRWRLGETAGGVKLARAHLTVNATSSTNLAARRPVIHPVIEPWAACNYSETTPKVDFRTELAVGLQVGTSQTLTFESDAFTAYLEASARYGVVHGFSFRAVVDISYISPANDLSGPLLVLYYYRTSSAPAAAAGP